MAPLKILIIGANGQIGTELAEALARRRERHGYRIVAVLA